VRPGFASAESRPGSRCPDRARPGGWLQRTSLLGGLSPIVDSHARFYWGARPQKMGRKRIVLGTLSVKASTALTRVSRAHRPRV